MTNTLETEIQKYRAAADERERLEALRASKIVERQEAQATAARLRQDMGARMLAAVLSDSGHDEATAINESAMANVKADALGQLVDALDAKIIEAQQTERTARANCMRADGTALLAEADERQKHTDALLAPLAEWEGVNYAPVRPEKSPQVTAQAMVMASGKFPVVPFVGLNTRSITEAMRDKGNALIKYADLVEAGTPIPTSIYTGEKLATVPDYLAMSEIPDTAKEF